MSSFRIDRQYVAFQTAETSPVYAASQTPRPKPNTAGSFDGDIGRLYDEIFERLSREHAEKTELMLSRASLEARDLVENAKRQAEEILSLAKAEAAQLREELSAGLEREAGEKRDRDEQGVLALETSLRAGYSELVNGMRDEVVALVMEIVRKVIGIKLSQSDEAFLGLVHDALERLKLTGSVVIRVGPEDYARYFGHERGAPDLDVGDMKVTVTEEPDFSAGDLIVESEGELVDLSINRQIDQIENAFKS